MKLFSFLFVTIQIFWNHICLHLAPETFLFLWKKEFIHFLATYWPLQWYTLMACLQKNKKHMQKFPSYNTYELRW